MGSPSASTKKQPTPMKGFVPGSLPKLKPKPNAQYVMPPKTTSRTFLTMMFTSFLGLTHPDSRTPKPENIQTCRSVDIWNEKWHSVNFSKQMNNNIHWEYILVLKIGNSFHETSQIYAQKIPNTTHGPYHGYIKFSQHYKLSPNHKEVTVNDVNPRQS